MSVFFCGGGGGEEEPHYIGVLIFSVERLYEKNEVQRGIWVKTQNFPYATACLF